MFETLLNLCICIRIFICIDIRIVFVTISISVKINELVNQVKKINLPKGKFAIFGSAVLAIRGLREAPNIDIIVKNTLWEDLLEKYQPDGEGFIRIGQIKISNWWFAPLRKDLSVIIDEAEIIEDLPFVKPEEVLFYKKTLKGEKDAIDVGLLERFMGDSVVGVPINLGISIYKNMIDKFVSEVKNNLPEVISMVIFGSVSRGQAKGDSDVDIFVFYDDTTIERSMVNNKMNKIILKLRKSDEYNKLEKENVHAEIYPFLISKRESMDFLWVFLDSLIDGIIILDKNYFVEKLMSRFRKNIESLGGRRVQLPIGGWCWLLFKDYKMAVNNLNF